MFKKVTEHVESIKFLETFLELKIEPEFDRIMWKGIGREHVDYGRGLWTFKYRTFSWLQYVQNNFINFTFLDFS